MPVGMGGSGLPTRTDAGLEADPAHGGTAEPKSPGQARKAVAPATGVDATQSCRGPRRVTDVDPSDVFQDNPFNGGSSQK